MDNEEGWEIKTLMQLLHSYCVSKVWRVLLWRRLLASGWQLLANYAVCPGGGEFDSFFHKSSKSTSYAQPLLPMGLNIDRCITEFIRISATLK